MYIDIVAMQLYLVDLTGTGVATMSSLAHLWDWDTEEQRKNRHVADWEWKCQKWAATCDAYRAIWLVFFEYGISDLFPWGENLVSFPDPFIQCVYLHQGWFGSGT